MAATVTFQGESGGDKPVLDEGGGNNSVFAAAFLDALETNTGIMSTPELFTRINKRVETSAAKNKFVQKPEFKSIKGAGHEVGDFFFVPRSQKTAALARCRLTAFDPVMSRDDGPYKPQPDGLLHICTVWDLRPAEVLMVGDYLYDVQVGRRAGTRTALVTHGRIWPFAGEADVVFADFVEGMGRLDNLCG